MTRPIPDALKLMRGTQRADRPDATARKRKQPARGASSPVMPRGLAGQRHAARCWRLIADQLGDQLRPVDTIALHVLSLHYQAVVDAAAELAETGATLPDRVGSSKRSPAGVIFLQHSDRLLRYLTEFAGTPRRAGLVEGTDDEESVEDLVARLFMGDLDD